MHGFRGWLSWTNRLQILPRYSATLPLVLACACSSTSSDTGFVEGGAALADAGSMTEYDHDAGTLHHECTHPYAADPRDQTMSGEPVRLVTSEGDPADPSDDQFDLQIPAEIKSWLEEQHWVREHSNWHNTRRCGFGSNAAALAARGLTCAPIQEGDPGDGYAFLVMHRHMIQSLKQAFPVHFASIRAFSHVPLTQADSENPFAWKNIQWTDSQLQAIALLEQIEEHLDAFTSEDDLGNWLQFAGGGASEGGLPGFGDGGFPGESGGPPGGGPPGVAGQEDTSTTDAGTASTSDAAAVEAGSRPAGGIHAGMHSQFAVPNSPYSLLDNDVNTLVVPFWRLHGWIDNIWGRYRQGQHIADDDPTYLAELSSQCEGMHALDDTAALAALEAGVESGPAEVGEFATKVAPIFQTYCRGCHSPSTASGGLTLTGLAASAVRAGLVGVRSRETDMALVEAGSPDQSWLMRKLIGDFTGIDCTDCKTTMPQAGAKPTSDEIASIRAWIASGATDQ